MSNAAKSFDILITTITNLILHNYFDNLNNFFSGVYIYIYINFEILNYCSFYNVAFEIRSFSSLLWCFELILKNQKNLSLLTRMFFDLEMKLLPIFIIFHGN